MQFPELIVVARVLGKAVARHILGCGSALQTSPSSALYRFQYPPLTVLFPEQRRLEKPTLATNYSQSKKSFLFWI